MSTASRQGFTSDTVDWEILILMDPLTRPSNSETAALFKQFQFHRAIDLPDQYPIFDLTQPASPDLHPESPYGVGRYNEKRVGVYETDLFQRAGSDRRDIHVGVDLAAPAGSKVYAFYAGTLLMAAVNGAPGDYGGTLITEHQLGERTIWALYGHLSHASVHNLKIGSSFSAGQILGWLGSESENGGWNPHLHFQLSWIKPTVCDLPGAVSEKDRAQALIDYPDPRLVLGPLY